MMVVVAVQSSRHRAATGLPDAVHAKAVITAREKCLIVIHHTDPLTGRPYLDK
jgi:hypothetical protein